MASSRKKLDPKLKRRWLRALRSGEYEKGKGALCELTRTGAKYCCLGVLYELVNGEAAWKGKYLLKTHLGGTTRYGVGLLGRTHVDELIELNDDNRTFNEVIDYIEKKL